MNKEKLDFFNEPYSAGIRKSILAFYLDVKINYQYVNFVKSKKI